MYRKKRVKPIKSRSREKTYMFSFYQSNHSNYTRLLNIAEPAFLLQQSCIRRKKTSGSAVSSFCLTKPLYNLGKYTAYFYKPETRGQGNSVLGGLTRTFSNTGSDPAVAPLQNTAEPSFVSTSKDQKNPASMGKKINSKTPGNLQLPWKNNGNSKAVASPNLKTAPPYKVVSITYEEIGLFPRSFSRVIDRFLKQIFSDVENLVIQEYRFYRYLFLTTIQTIFVFVFVPLFVNLIAKTYLIRPVTEFFWNTKQTEIFLNSYEQKRAFIELQDFEEKLYFESLLTYGDFKKAGNSYGINYGMAGQNLGSNESVIMQNGPKGPGFTALNIAPALPVKNIKTPDKNNNQPNAGDQRTVTQSPGESLNQSSITQNLYGGGGNNVSTTETFTAAKLHPPEKVMEDIEPAFRQGGVGNKNLQFRLDSTLNNSAEPYTGANTAFTADAALLQKENWLVKFAGTFNFFTSTADEKEKNLKGLANSNLGLSPTGVENKLNLQNNTALPENLNKLANSSTNLGGAVLAINTAASQTANPIGIGSGAFNLLQERLQEKTVELAVRYNNHSIESITNFFADFLSLLTLLYLLVSFEIQINITKSFLLEVFFGLDDSKKSLLILIMTDLLVGYHSSNLWELFFQFLFNHYGIPESQTGIFLLVATLPVLLDVLFKYLIFRHLNRASPATVATYHAIIE
uniref:Potassium/proton antiporter CemA n=1 Tax=Chlamydomonas peterfii TaxID=28462 RepID=A0A0S2ICY6_9CHLO|nr:chloroplast enveloppe membrane protein [Chlamydomonas peterfii]